MTAGAKFIYFKHFINHNKIFSQHIHRLTIVLFNINYKVHIL